MQAIIQTNFKEKQQTLKTQYFGVFFIFRNFIRQHKNTQNTLLNIDGKGQLHTGKSLQAEYAVLLEEEKNTYAEYQRSCEEMRELL